MGLFDNIEKLITEHGSASILKERITLIREQCAALEKKLTESEIRSMDLQSEKERVELENFRLKEKIRKLEERLSADKGAERMEELREDILRLFSRNENITDGQVAAAVFIGVQLATFHLKELAQMGFVSCNHISGSDWTGERPRTEWYIMQPGRSYLVSHGLLQ